MRSIFNIINPYVLTVNIPGKVQYVRLNGRRALGSLGTVGVIERVTGGVIHGVFIPGQKNDVLVPGRGNDAGGPEIQGSWYTTRLMPALTISFAQMTQG